MGPCYCRPDYGKFNHVFVPFEVQCPFKPLLSSVLIELRTLPLKVRNVQPQSINLSLYHPLLAPLQSQSTQIKLIRTDFYKFDQFRGGVDKLCTCVIECETTDQI